MPTLITDEFESYFVEEISAKVEDMERMHAYYIF